MTSSESVTIAAECYSSHDIRPIRMLKTFFSEMKRDADLNRAWFQQDGAANQTAFACMNFLSLFLGLPEK
jgi:hypothetical protein